MFYCFYLSSLKSVFYSTSFHLLSYYISILILIFILLTHYCCIYQILSQNWPSSFCSRGQWYIIILVCDGLFEIKNDKFQALNILMQLKTILKKPKNAAPVYILIISNKTDHSVTDWRKMRKDKSEKRQKFHCGILPSKNLFEAKCVSQSLSTCPRHTNLSSRAGERERILAEILDTVCKVPSGSEKMLL